MEKTRIAAERDQAFAFFSFLFYKPPPIDIQYTLYNKKRAGDEMSSTQMIVRIDGKVKSRLDKLARMEGKTTSKMVRELIEQYIDERDIGSYIDGLWGKIGKKLSGKGVTSADIEQAITTARNKRK